MYLSASLICSTYTRKDGESGTLNHLSYGTLWTVYIVPVVVTVLWSDVNHVILHPSPPPPPLLSCMLNRLRRQEYLMPYFQMECAIASTITHYDILFLAIKVHKIRSQMYPIMVLYM